MEFQNRYFNEQSLEKEVERIIKPFVKNNIEVNKIVIPLSKKDKKTPLNYARVFFYVSNLRDAKRDVVAIRDPMIAGELDKPEKNDYEIVLGHIAEKLNED